MKKRVILIILFIGMLLIISNLLLSYSYQHAGKVDKKILEEFDTDGKDKVKVIVVMKPEIFGSVKIQETKDNLKGKIKNSFNSFNGFSAEIDLSELENLERDNNVESIYYDYPVHALLQDSVPLINATTSWNFQVNSLNITGLGQTICIIDTGINYSHPDLGGCVISPYTTDGINKSFILESAHNYTDNFDYTWNITMEGYSNIAVHFKNISLEYLGEVGGYDSTDRVIIYDSDMREIARYKGLQQPMTDVWTPYSNGDTIYVRLTSNVAMTDYGFYIDYIKNGTTNSTYNWSSCGKVIGGWNFVDNNGNPYDDHGHGTHCAGIAAGNGILDGVAPDSKLIAVKSLDSAGSGWDSDVIAGIEYCTNNSEKYNISVISLSLGGNTLYSNYCDSSDTLTAAAINYAAAKNISVVVASGNNYSNSKMTSPACIFNSTSIGATNKDDTVASYSNRNNMTKLFAPGTSINSTSHTGGYIVHSGTSMATPHSAGAIALLKQYLNLSGKIKDTKQIEDIFNITGKFINDTSGNNLSVSRVNVYSAILYLNNPSINFTFPTEDSGVYLRRNNILVNLSSDSQNILNMTVYLYNSSSLVNLSNSSTNNLFVNFTGLTEGIYFFNSTIYNTENASNSTETRNATVDLSLPQFFNITSSGVYSRYNNLTINISFRDNYSLDSAIIEINNTGVILNNTYNISGINFNISKSFNISGDLKNLNLTFKIHVNDSAGNSNHSAWYNISVVNTPPVLLLDVVNQSWVMNSNKTINLSVYFSDVDLDDLTFSNDSIENIVISFNQTTGEVKLIPDNNFNGTKYVIFYANDGINTTATNNLSLTVFKPVINFTSFDGATTNFTNLSNFVNVSAVIEKSNYGKINFSSITLDNNSLDFDLHINISSNWVEINSSALPNLNTSAILYLYNLTFSNPRILKNGAVCSDCVIISYSAGSLVFNVTSFSSYSSEETPVQQITSGSSPGGGGGASVSETIYSPTEEQLNLGFTRELSRNDKFKFDISGIHYAKLIGIVGSEIVIEVSSTPQTATMAIGDEKKFELTGDGFYDLLVKLNRIAGTKANITIQKINELIPLVQETIKNETEADEKKNLTDSGNILDEEGKTDWKKKIIWVASSLAVLIVIYLAYWFIRKNQKKEHKHKSAHIIRRKKKNYGFK
jgi:subtilisin family serine protease